ncbi:hypothetical protein SAY87_027193 [Trapa incisa]|uniref:Secreted protein n=1 Tax=Trapa incisa TaxID=236973 RepID=A0AAN7H254_9MYRT|nr:hypothetical protein SAY87_027193 [Trapa incisa]
MFLLCFFQTYMLQVANCRTFSFPFSVCIGNKANGLPRVAEGLSTGISLGWIVTKFVEIQAGKYWAPPRECGLHSSSRRKLWFRPWWNSHVSAASSAHLIIGISCPA